MSPATKAEIALLVAGVSAGISLANLAWQLVVYRLSGARLIVRLIPAVITEAGHLIKGPASGWKPSTPEEMKGAVHNRPWVDVAIIELVNRGRAPVSLSTINFDVGADPRWKLWCRHTIGVPAIALHGGLADAREVRLDPGRFAFAIFDYWPAVESGRKLRRRVALRATAQPAGRRTKRSRWRHRWVFEPTEHHLWPHGPEGDQVQLFQAVWREVAPTSPSGAYDAWLSILRLLMPEDVDPRQIGVLDVSRALEPIFGDAMRAMLPSVNILNALHKYGQAGAWIQRPGTSGTQEA